MDRILIVEDDTEIGQLLQDILAQANYESHHLLSGEKAISFLSAQHYDLILLDLMLPGIQGEDLLPKIREINQIPILIISAKGGLESKVAMLQKGADDYISKPFEPKEVIARIEAALRRYRGNRTNQILYDDIVIDLDAQNVWVQGHEMSLTAKEYAILKLLCTYPSKVFSKANLYESIWHELYAYDDNLLGVHISNLRKKLKEHTGKEYIQTVWGIGYKIR